MIYKEALGGTYSGDKAAFTPGISSGTPTMGVVSPADTPAAGTFAVVALDANRNMKVNVVAGGAGGGAVTVADGADVTQGAIADVAVFTDASGTVNAHLRGLVKLLAACITIGSNWMQVSIQNATLAVTQSGTWLLNAATSGGSTPYSYIAAAAANQDSTIVKASAGQVYAISGISVIATLLYLKVYDKATGPTSADTPVLRFPIPASTTGAGYTFPLPRGAQFTNGISFRITTGIADSNAVAATANDCIVNLLFK